MQQKNIKIKKKTGTKKATSNSTKTMNDMDCAGQWQITIDDVDENDHQDVDDDDGKIHVRYARYRRRHCCQKLDRETQKCKIIKTNKLSVRVCVFVSSTI